MSQLANLFNKYDAVVFFDTETTGLDPKENRVIELAALRVERQTDGSLTMAAKMDAFLLLPDGEEIPARITELTGITDEQLQAEGITEEAAAVDFLDLIEGHTLLVAYNAQFDLLFTREIFRRLGAGSDKFEACDALDSLTIYKDRAQYPHKLASAIEHYGLQGKVRNSHRAIDDVMALYCVTYQMAEERMDLDAYVNIFGYNVKYGVMCEEIRGITYHAQGNAWSIKDEDMILPEIVRKERGDGQMTLDDVLGNKEAAHD